jgi:hypothetical protein
MKQKKLTIISIVILYLLSFLFIKKGLRYLFPTLSFWQILVIIFIIFIFIGTITGKIMGKKFNDFFSK